MSTATHSVSPRHVVVINRWSSDYAVYRDYVDVDTELVTFVCSPPAEAYCRSLGHDVEVVDSTRDVAAVEAAARRLAARSGPVDAVVALYEDDQLVASELRDRFGCPGPTTKHLVPFRDKLVMLRTAADAGLEVPAFAEVATPDDLRRFVDTHGLPVVVKPRMESSAAGVRIIDDDADLDDVLAGRPSDAQSLVAQVFVDEPILHVDGYAVDHDIRDIRASRYVSTCLEFRNAGATLGSVELDADDPDLARVTEFARRAVRALSPEVGDLVFHLEVFLGTDEVRLLEIGARVGGAMVPFLWREVHGLDLMGIAWDLSLGRPVSDERVYRSDPDTVGDAGGWLLVHELDPAAVALARSGELTALVPELHAMLLDTSEPPTGSEATYFEHVGGRFRYSSSRSSDVLSAIERTSDLLAGARETVEVTA